MDSENFFNQWNENNPSFWNELWIQTLTIVNRELNRNMRYGADRGIKEDLASESLLILWSRHKSGTTISNPMGYLRKIIRTLIISRLKSANKMAQFFSLTIHTLESNFQSDSEELDELKILHEKLEKALKKMADKPKTNCHQLIQILLGPKKSHEEISLILGVERGSIKAKRDRCLKMLRKLMES